MCFLLQIGSPLGQEPTSTGGAVPGRVLLPTALDPDPGENVEIRAETGQTNEAKLDVRTPWIEPPWIDPAADESIANLLMNSNSMRAVLFPGSGHHKSGEDSYTRTRWLRGWFSGSDSAWTWTKPWPGGVCDGEPLSHGLPLL